jgi:hypothetical protein
MWDPPLCRPLRRRADPRGVAYWHADDAADRLDIATALSRPRAARRAKDDSARRWENRFDLVAADGENAAHEQPRLDDQLNPVVAEADVLNAPALSSRKRDLKAAAHRPPLVHPLRFGYLS